ncbi:MAG: NAD(+)/NADH kinase [Pseudomonadales bacterium]
MARSAAAGAPVKVAICVNPMSGRDVRRLAARATNMTHEAKRDMVARVAAGAAACGATDLYVTREPFRIAAAALEHMELDARVHVLTPRIRNSAEDTELAVQAFLDAGCETLVSLGGDGTNRALVRALGSRAERVRLIPLSTGTNNVFPVLVEPTVAGMAAALAASGALRGAPADARVEARCKVIHVSGSGRYGLAVSDVGLIDAVLLRRDHVGNLLPFDADRIDRLLLTRAEPDAIGMSPIGGLLYPVDALADRGLLVQMGPGRHFQAPLSPGWFREVSVAGATPVDLGQTVSFPGEGVLALDGDRDHKIPAGAALSLVIRRDGPWVVDVSAAMRWAVADGIMPDSSARHAIP